MAHFAELGLNNTVLRVIVVHNNELLDENSVEQEVKGADFCRNLFGGTWVQTSYNANSRKNFAGAGFTYDSERDAFIPPKPAGNWVLNEETCQWEESSAEDVIEVEGGDITIEETPVAEEQDPTTPPPVSDCDADVGNEGVVILSNDVYSGNDNDNDSIILTE